MKQYSNMDLIMETVNAHFDKWAVHVQYGTLSEYFALINTDASNAVTAPTARVNQASIWPSYSGDFMPLGTNNNIYNSQIDWNVTKMNVDTEYWTGHYTTRPLMKHLTAAAGIAKHSSEIAASLYCARHTSTGADMCDPTAALSDLMLVRKVTGALQHHDSITGTSRPEVTANLDVSDGQCRGHLFALSSLTLPLPLITSD